LIALFPLTPALSLGERESVTTLSESSKGAGFVATLGTPERETIRTFESISIAKRLQAFLPLPKGEGRGEGEGSVLTFQPLSFRRDVR
jgi:hypothetical protein